MTRCFLCLRAKGTLSNASLYTLLPVSNGLWLYISMNFVLGLTSTQHAMDSIFVVVDQFSKMANFVACRKTMDATRIAHLYLKEITCLHGVPRSITSDQDIKFMSNFLKSLWESTEESYGNEPSESTRPTQKAIQASNAKYKVCEVCADNSRHQVLFDVEDFVWAVVTRVCIPVGEYNKLKDRKIGPCEVLQKINDNAYRLHLPSHMRTSDMFNIKHRSPCFVNDGMNSRASSV
ncbi:uncharacterized protein LOC121262075 [Juglans microcarpa x Juglans regia]|uniref:uncharacterized protein LOC121262075 n=1 Tax=Juglans microcarpa x Juglans regia TaxID=2249226 RepID=UPI001B7DDB24|nr:uncharacterized protein LOC121262075 [Juglans microcarpa x Juglans regia]